MFQLSTLEQKVRVIPSELGKPNLEAVTAVIEELFLDKVVENLGLAISIYDILDIQGGVIYPTDGAAHFQATFRLIFFRPFIGEVLTGKLVSSDCMGGLKVSMDFFEDIFIPPHALMDPASYDVAAEAWYWEYISAEENPEPADAFELSKDKTYWFQKLYLYVGTDIRFRVKQIKFKKPPTPADLMARTEGAIPEGTAANPFAPMKIIATINEDGLGCLDWWGEAAPEAEEGGDEVD